MKQKAVGKALRAWVTTLEVYSGTFFGKEGKGEDWAEAARGPLMARVASGQGAGDLVPCVSGSLAGGLPGRRLQPWRTAGG